MAPASPELRSKNAGGRLAAYRRTASAPSAKQASSTRSMSRAVARSASPGAPSTNVTPPASARTRLIHIPLRALLRSQEGIGECGEVSIPRLLHAVIVHIHDLGPHQS